MIAVFGGAFDPVHFGHIKPAIELSQHAEIEQVRFLPCHDHPQKENISASAFHRLSMLRLIASPPQLVVDTRELACNAVAYTVDSLRQLRAEYGAKQVLAFVLGEDAFATIRSWHRFVQLFDYSHFIVLARPTQSPPANNRDLPAGAELCSSLADLAKRPTGGVVYFANRQYRISSTMIKNMIANQQAPRYCLPAKVWCYIRYHQLYGCHGRR